MRSDQPNPQADDRIIRRSPALPESVTPGSSNVSGAFADKTSIDNVLPDDGIPGYQVLEQIGRGGQATVWRAVELSTSRIVALKVLLSGPFATGSKQEKRFQREIAMLASLEHPNIATAYNSGQATGALWFSMELIEGDPLIRHAETRTLDVRRRVELFARVADAVGAAHSLGIIHRDLKPSNILVGLDGEPHVLDFGLARDADEDSTVRFSSTGEILGTLPYLSPEQIWGRDVDERADVHALGVLLYELLAGRMPYPVDCPRIETMRHVLTTDPPPISGLADDLWRIVQRSLAKERERRYANAAMLAADLKRWLNGEAVEAKADSRWYRARKWMRRHWIGVGATAAAMLIATSAGLAAYSAWQKHQVSESAGVALDASGLALIGSVQRDAGRADVALGFFEDALAITEQADSNDPGVLHARYGVLHRIAWQHYSDGAVDRGDKYRNIAHKVVERLHRIKPQDTDTTHHLALSQSLEGRGWTARDDWRSGLECFRKAHAKLDALLAEDPENKTYQAHTALCLRWIGRCLLEIGEYDASRAEHLKAREITEELLRLEPNSAEHRLDLIRCDQRLARCEIRRNTQEGDLRAVEILNTALLELDKVDPSQGQSRDTDSLRHDMNALLGFLDRRITRRNQKNSSSPVSTGTSSPSPSGSEVDSSLNE